LPVPSNSISRIADKARLSEKTVRKALEVLSIVGDNALLSGKNPVSLAAASLYLATIETGEYTTQLRIAIAADVSTVTVRKRCLEIIQLVKASNSKLLKVEKSQEYLMSEDKPAKEQESEQTRNVKGLFLATKQLPDLPVQ
jgi:transcription initiation factor TFIIB